MCFSPFQSLSSTPGAIILGYIYIYIYIYMLSLLCILWTTMLFTMSYYTVYTHLLPLKFPTPPRIRTLVLSIHCPTLYPIHQQMLTNCCDFVFINREIYSFQHNTNNLIEYFSLMQSCLKIYWINVLYYQFLPFIYNENHSKKNNSVLLWCSLSV